MEWLALFGLVIGLAIGAVVSILRLDAEKRELENRAKNLERRVFLGLP